MPNYVIVQVDPLPTVGGTPKAATVALVSAADPGAAMDVYATMIGSITPVVAQVAVGSAFTRYTNTATVTRSSTAG